MAMSFDQALGIHPQALKIRTQRAQVLANNMANVDTPDFKARDVDFQAILRGELDLANSQTGMRVTSDKHMAGQTLISDNSLKYRIPLQPSIDGNTVEEQVEHANYMENAMALQASFTFLNSKFRGLLTAIKGE